jgi:hypothetical protein
VARDQCARTKCYCHGAWFADANVVVVGGAWLRSEYDFPFFLKSSRRGNRLIWGQLDQNRAIQPHFDVIRTCLHCRSNGSGNVSLGEMGRAAWH